jgi:hypothetical protein
VALTPAADPASEEARFEAICANVGASVKFPYWSQVPPQLVDPVAV